MRFAFAAAAAAALVAMPAAAQRQYIGRLAGVVTSGGYGVDDPTQPFFQDLTGERIVIDFDVTKSFYCADPSNSLSCSDWTDGHIIFSGPWGHSFSILPGEQPAFLKAISFFGSQDAAELRFADTVYNPLNASFDTTFSFFKSSGFVEGSGTLFHGFYFGTPRAALYDFAITSGYVYAVVPEPATWAMMIIGFGAVGAAARSRRVAAPA